VLFLHDLTRIDAPEYIAQESMVTRVLAEKVPESVPVLDVWNKADACPTAAPAGALALSARTGAGLDALRRRLLELAGWQAAPDGVYMARERHLQALRRVQAHLQQAAELLQQQAQALDLLAEELRLAQNALGEITGQFSADDLLGVIFSKFCIGK
jgi:tRNA modification GTPase